MSSVGAEPVIKIGGRGHLTTNYATLDEDFDFKESLHLLDDRTRELKAEINRIAARLFEDAPLIERRTAAIEKQLADSIENLERQSRRVATGGIKAILGGLAIVGAGVVVQSLSIYA